MSEQPTIILGLKGMVVPKARPRSSGRSKRVYTSPKYQEWKDNALVELLSQESRSLKVSGVEVVMLFLNSLRGNGDIDNGIGSVLDALVKAEILYDDSCNHVSKETVVFVREKAKKGEEKVIATSILIRPPIETLEDRKMAEYAKTYLSR